MIVLRRRKGGRPRELWTATNGRLLARAPGSDHECEENPEHLQLLENWMRGYKPEELFDQTGKLRAEFKEIAPAGTRRMGSNSHANGGRLRGAPVAGLPPVRR